MYPHKDSLVISVDVASKRFNRILVDTRSSVDVMFKSTLDNVGIAGLRLESTNTSMKGFRGEANPTWCGRVAYHNRYQHISENRDAGFCGS